jgi:hypothetical protein
MKKYFTILILCILIWIPNKFLVFFNRWVRQPFLYKKVVYYPIEQHFPKLTSRDLVEVQPMSKPSDKISYWDLKYDKSCK